MGAVQEVVAGKTPEDQSAHLAQVFRQHTEDDRNALLFTKAFPAYQVSADDTLSLALDLRLSNAQTRKLRHWTKQWKVHLASEGKCRSKANELMGEVDLTVEMVQTTNIEEGQCVIKPAALCRVKNESCYRQ